MKDAKKFIEDLIELGCPHEYCFGNAKEGYAWIVGRLSAYGITPNGEDVEELVFFLKGAKNKIPHVDTSLIKRDQPKTSGNDEGFITPNDDPVLKKKLTKFFAAAIFPQTEEYIEVIYKNRGFRLLVERYSVTATVMNVDSMRYDPNDEDEIICTASFIQLELEELEEYMTVSMPKPSYQSNSSIPIFHSIKLTDALDFFADNGNVSRSVDRAISQLEEINRKHNNDN